MSSHYQSLYILTGLKRRLGHEHESIVLSKNPPHGSLIQINVVAHQPASIWAQRMHQGQVVAPDAGLRTERRISHVFALDVRSYPRTLFITDVAINIYPTLQDRSDAVSLATFAMPDEGTPLSRRRRSILN